MEYKSALDYIHSDKYKTFHKERKEKQKSVKDLKQMISEPASKEWFAKHGGGKQKALQNKMK